jgi:hypothetical protein
VLPDGEDGRLVGRILHDVFLLGNPDKEAEALAVRDLFFDMVGRQHTLKVTNGGIAKGVNVVAENQGVGLGLDQARFVNDDRQAGRLVLGLSCGRGEQRGRQSERQSWEHLSREELIDLFRQLPPKDQQWALARLIENTLALSPHHFHNLSVSDLPLRRGAVLVGDEREDRARKFRPFPLVNIGVSHL